MCKCVCVYIYIYIYIYIQREREREREREIPLRDDFPTLIDLFLGKYQVDIKMKYGRGLI